MEKRLIPLLFVLFGCTKNSPGQPQLPVALSDLNGHKAQDLNHINDKHISYRVAEKAEYKVQIFSDLDEEKAKGLIKQKLFLVQSLFKEEKSPYPGMTSNLIKCNPQFLQVKSEINDENRLALRIQLYANSRKVFGVCSKDEIHFKTVYLFVYCKQSRKALLVEGYSPESNTLDWAQWLIPGNCL